MQKLIVFQKNFTYLYFNKSVYNFDNIKFSLVDFNEIIDYSIIEIGKFYVLKFSIREDFNEEFSDEDLKREISLSIFSLVNSKEFEVSF